MMPPMRMEHSCDRIGWCSVLSVFFHADLSDVVHDGLVYASGYTKVLLDMDPDSPVMIPVMGVFSRVADGPERGKISVMTIYEDHVPLMQKLQSMIK